MSKKPSLAIVPTDKNKKHFNDHEIATITFENSDGTKKVMLTLQMNTKNSLTECKMEFEPEIEAGSKPEYYAALALQYISSLQG